MEKRSVILLVLLLSILPTVSSYEFCPAPVPNSNLEIHNIVYYGAEDEEEWKWGPREELTIEVEVENKEYTERKFDLEIFLINEDLDKIIPAEDSSNIETTTNLYKGENDKINFSFTLKEEVGGIYSLHAGLRDNSNSTICTSLEAASKGDEVILEIEEEDKIIVIRKVLGPTNTTVGEELEYIVEIANFGNVPEERVLVKLYSSNLEATVEKEVKNLKVDEIKNVTLKLNIPENTTTETGNLVFSIEYGYSEDSGFYYEFNDKDKLIDLEIILPQVGNNTQPATKENKTTLIEDAEAEKESKVRSIYFIWSWKTGIVLASLSIVTAIFFYLRNRGRSNAGMPTSANSAVVSSYVRSIKESSDSSPPTSPSSQDKPS